MAPGEMVFGFEAKSFQSKSDDLIKRRKWVYVIMKEDPISSYKLSNLRRISETENEEFDFLRKL